MLRSWRASAWHKTKYSCSTCFFSSSFCHRIYEVFGHGAPEQARTPAKQAGRQVDSGWASGMCGAFDDCALEKQPSGMQKRDTHEGRPLPPFPPLSSGEKRRHAYGRTALMLSGGAAMGVYHAGVVKVSVRRGIKRKVLLLLHFLCGLLLLRG